MAFVMTQSAVTEDEVELESSDHRLGLNLSKSSGKTLNATLFLCVCVFYYMVYLPFLS